jgi:methyl-accepting chemotaxis protein
MAKKNVVDIVEDKNPTFANMIKDIRDQKELEKSLVYYLREKEKLLIAKARDEDLTKLKEKKGELSKPYNQTITALKNMITCIYKFGHRFENELKEEFEKNLVQYNKQLSYIKSQKDENEELQSVTEAINEINEDYKTIKDLELKCEYIAHIIKERYDLDEPEKIEI